MAKQANVLAASATDDTEAWTEHACLAIKAETANRVGFRAWSRLTGDRADRARPLVQRIQRHSHEADAALERAGVAILRRGLDGRNDGPERRPLGTSQRADAVRRILGRRLTVVAAGLLVAAAAVIMVGGPRWVPALDGSPPEREGTLAGPGPGPGSSVATPEPGVAGPTPGATQPATILSVDFDRERMGQGLGPDWVQTAGGAEAVSLAPFPTAVNRSARLQSAGAAGAAEACRPVSETAVRVTGLVVEVVIGEPSTTAQLIGRDESGAPILLLGLGTSGSTFTAERGDVLARGSGVQVGEWVRTEITALGERTRWQAHGEQSGAIIDQTIDVSALGELEQVCLAVRATSAGAAHFDNMTIATVKEG